MQLRIKTYIDVSLSTNDINNQVPSTEGALVKLIHTAAAFLTFAFLSSTAYPVPIYSLVDYGFNIDGELSFASDPTPADVDISGFDTGTGLGTITATISGAGAHLFLFFEDIDIDTAINGSFNELGVAYGSPGAGQSWEIDEPDFDTGDILDSTLLLWYTFLWICSVISDAHHTHIYY